MVELVVPSATDNRFFKAWDIGFGPISPDAIFHGSSVSLSGIKGSFDELRGIYGENSVYHESYFGSVEYSPMYVESVSAGDSAFPCRRKVKVRRDGGSIETWDLPYGIARHEGTAYGRLNHPTKQALHYAFVRSPEGRWQFYMCQNAPNDYESVNSYGMTEIIEIRPFYGDMKILVCRNRACAYSLGTTGLKPGVDCSKPIDFYTLSHLFPLQSTWSGPQHGGYIYVAGPKGPSTLNEDESLALSDKLIVDLRKSQFAIPGVDFGDLAQSASQKVNKTNVNVVALLRDLRHPTDMIPKLLKLRDLKDLHKLKTYADSYLSVKYGVLPTISDLKDILAAFNRAKPYIDRNGFETYSQGYTETVQSQDMTFTLCQHVKLGIAKEDEALEDLIGRLESIGVFPTFKNIWDLIPFTFVLDWFADVGSFLERVDTNLRLLRLNIKYATLSRKEIRTKFYSGSSDFPFTGSTQYSSYHRWVTDHPPEPSLSLRFSTDFLDHFIEGGALIIQRKKL